MLGRWLRGVSVLFSGLIRYLTQFNTGFCRVNIVSLRQADGHVATRRVLPCDGEWLACDDVQTALRDVDIVWLGLRERDGCEC